MSDFVIVKAKIKDVVGNYNVSSDFAEELDKHVKGLIKKAAERADSNNRKTVMAKDL
ncbi:MAG: DUF1931 domain-containing protein [Candidatus Woesearchaeota archaeon]|nr:MAG: DUF1931 domain-containing protein [Candidatus Woesearchaeota archaeon]